MRETNNGKRQLTATREQDLNLKVFSIQRYPHLIEPWWKFCGEPLHNYQDIIFHIFKHIRAECRRWDLGQPFVVAGPVCESYENTGAKILSKKKPVQKVLQSLVYDFYFIATAAVEGEKSTQSQRIMFLPTPMQEPGQNRFLNASLSAGMFQVNDDFEFDAPESTSGGPLEVEIPLEASTVCVQFVTRSNRQSLAIGL